MNTIVRTNTVLEKSYVMPIILVCTNDKTVQDIALTIQLVDLISFHKRMFKAESYFSYCRKVYVDLSKSSESIPANMILVGDCWKKI